MSICLPAAHSADALHAKIRQQALEIDFLSGALTLQIGRRTLASGGLDQPPGTVMALVEHVDDRLLY